MGEKVELTECPNCKSKNKDPQHPNCWHCLDCKWVNCANMIINPDEMNVIYKAPPP